MHDDGIRQSLSNFLAPFGSEVQATFPWWVKPTMGRLLLAVEAAVWFPLMVLVAWRLQYWQSTLNYFIESLIWFVPLILLAAICNVLSHRLRYIASKFYAPLNLRVVMQSSTAPVLYLRDFRRDHEFKLHSRQSFDVVEADDDELVLKWRMPGAPAFVLIMALFLWLTRGIGGRARHWSIEEEVNRFFRPVRPVIAIGKPGEWLPSSGACRLYVTDRAWQDVARELIKRAHLVVLRVGSSQGLRWELRCIGELSVQKKLVVLTVDEYGAPLSGKALESLGQELRMAFNVTIPRSSLPITMIRFRQNGQPELLSASAFEPVASDIADGFEAMGEPPPRKWWGWLALPRFSNFECREPMVIRAALLTGFAIVALGLMSMTTIREEFEIAGRKLELFLSSWGLVFLVIIIVIDIAARFVPNRWLRHTPLKPPPRLFD